MNTKEKIIENKSDLSKLLKPSHENKWVAISRDYRKVVDFADSLVDLDKKIKDPMSVIYTRILSRDVSFAPAGF